MFLNPLEKVFVRSTMLAGLIRFSTVLICSGEKNTVDIIAPLGIVMLSILILQLNQLRERQKREWEAENNHSRNFNSNNPLTTLSSNH